MGNAYGTTAAGGFLGGQAGTVYQFSPTSGYHVIYAFSGPDGLKPQGNLVIDAAGNLYGTTVYGGAHKSGCNGLGCGTVFELSPPSNGGTWTETVLYSFTGGDDGANPQSGVILDLAGNLYGTTEFGGARGVGTVFQLSPGPGGTWTENVLYGMEQGGGGPIGGLVLDAFGNLYGTTCCFGPQNGGTAFELSPFLDSWTYTLVYAFDSSDGSNDAINPDAILVFDEAGNLYGTATAGGNFGRGAVFELSQVSGKWTEEILHSFAGGRDGATPMASLVLDNAGNLYGTTYEGGNVKEACPQGCGTIFELSPSFDGQWTERGFRFPGDAKLGAQPTAPLVIDGVGNLYGTAIRGGNESRGVIFRVKP
ncbi:MAG: hypothetical protein LAO09_11630 [Acidobacteriia bacterium]|nr:hypothetical protein [Terriglobia bacterium]